MLVQKILYVSEKWDENLDTQIYTHTNFYSSDEGRSNKNIYKDDLTEREKRLARFECEWLHISTNDAKINNAQCRWHKCKQVKKSEVLTPKKKWYFPCFVVIRLFVALKNMMLIENAARKIVPLKFIVTGPFFLSLSLLSKVQYGIKSEKKWKKNIYSLNFPFQFDITILWCKKIYIQYMLACYTFSLLSSYVVKIFVIEINRIFFLLFEWMMASWRRRMNENFFAVEIWMVGMKNGGL